MSQPALLLRRALPTDRHEILAIARENALPSEPAQDLQHAGFLVSGFSAEEYETFSGCMDHFYVAARGVHLEGFVLAYSSTLMQASELQNLRLRDRLGKDFVLVKQICTRRDIAGTGVGAKLYRHLILQTSSRPLAAAIVLHPPNPHSVRFHEHMGFRKFLEFTPPDGMPRGIWIKA